MAPNIKREYLLHKENSQLARKQNICGVNTTWFVHDLPSKTGGIPSYYIYWTDGTGDWVMDKPIVLYLQRKQGRKKAKKITY